MRWGVAVVVLASLWLGSVRSFAAEAPPPAASAFGRVPAMESVALSPNGQLIAWVENSGAQSIIQVLDLAKGAQVRRVDVPGNLKVHGLDWADDEILLIHDLVRPTYGAIESPVYEWLRTAAMEVATGKSRPLLVKSANRFHVPAARLLALHPSKPRTVIMSSWTFAGLRPGGEYVRRGNNFSQGHDLYEVDTLTGEDKVTHWGTEFTNDWVVDAGGQAVARSEWFAKRKLYTVLHRRASGWVEIFRLENGEKPELLGSTRDGSAVLMAATLDRKHVAVWRVPVDGSAPRLAIGDESSDITRLVRDPYSKEPLGGWIEGLTPEIRWLDEQAEKRSKSLRKTFGGKHAALIGRSADGGRALVSVGAHSAPVTYYLVDFKRGTADIVGEEYPALVDVPLGKVRALTFKARDGYDIPAYLTLPPGARAEKLPLVVLPHYWPGGRDEASFHPAAQFLATRGYAVLQPQFRGSTGFGAAHRKAGYLQWGGLMQDDVTDGVRAMIEQGVADPKRVCIVGMGYGGYVALAGAAFTPELYACAISVNGISDLPDLISSPHPLGIDLQEEIGRKGSPELAAKSPARAASRVRAPILLMHGVDALMVPVVQSQTMMKALGGQAPHELIELPGDDPWQSRGESRIRVLTEMERFLAKHLPASGEGGD